MTEDQQVILSKVVKELGHSVLHLKDGIGETFHIGTVSLLDGSSLVSFYGFDATTLFVTMKRDMTANMMADSIDRMHTQIGSMHMKFPMLSDWRLYSA